MNGSVNAQPDAGSNYTATGVRTAPALVFHSCTISHTDPMNRNGEE
jgi:hypothetical protein